MKALVSAAVVICAMLAISNSVAANEEEALDFSSFQPVNQMLSATRQYFKIYGEFPQTWHDVVEAGIIRPSFEIGSVSMTPDNGRADFPGDVTFMGRQPDGKCRFMWHKPDGSGDMLLEVGPAESYEAVLTRLSLSAKTQGVESHLENYLSDERWLRLIAAAAVLQQSLVVYFLNEGEASQGGFQAFQRSYYNPLTATMLNPVTGQPFRFDGSPSNLLVVWPDDDAGEEVSPSVWAVDEDGQQLVMAP